MTSETTTAAAAARRAQYITCLWRTGDKKKKGLVNRHTRDSNGLLGITIQRTIHVIYARPRVAWENINSVLL